MIDSNKVRHWIFILLYILILSITGIFIVFPLFFLKFFHLYNTSWIIDLYVNSVQHYSNFLVLNILGTHVYMYIDKDSINDAKFDYKGPVLITANHLCELDPLYLGIIQLDFFNVFIHLTTFVKHTLRFYPFIHCLLLANDAIFVQNKNTSQNKEQHGYIIDKLKKVGHRHVKGVMLFPEGTTFSNEVKKYREEQDKDIRYNNLLIPRTNGLHMVREHCDIKEEYNIVIKFVNRKPTDDPSLIGLINGQSPKEVHLMFRKRKSAFDPQLLTTENRAGFDKDIRNTFAEMDKTLDIPIEDWSTTYHQKRIRTKFADIFWFLIYTPLSFLALYNALTNLYVFYFSCLSVVFYYFAAFFEHRRTKKKID